MNISSNILARETCLKKHNLELYNEVISYSLLHKIEVSSFSERVYWYLNKMTEYPKCKFCHVEKVKYKSFSEGYREYCCNVCAGQSKLTQEKRKDTLQEEFGVDNISQVQSIKKSKEDTFIKNYGKKHIWAKNNKDDVRSCEVTCLERYGVDNVFKLEEIQDRIIKIFFLKYGVKCPLQNKDILHKSIKTLLEHYKVDNPFKSKEIQQRAKEASLKVYGTEYSIQNKDVLLKSVTTLLKNYGVKYPTQNEELYKKSLETLFKNYGVTNARYLQKVSKQSKPELEVRQKLNASSFKFKNKEYDVKVDNNLFEIDGDFYHPNKIENLTFIQLNNILNDYRKLRNLEETQYTLYRVYISNLPKEITVDNLIKNSYTPNYFIADNQVIINSEYIKKYFEKKSKHLREYTNLLSKFFIELKLTSLDKETVNLKIASLIKNYKDITISNFNL